MVNVIRNVKDRNVVRNSRHTGRRLDNGTDQRTKSETATTTRVSKSAMLAWTLVTILALRCVHHDISHRSLSSSLSPTPPSKNPTETTSITSATSIVSAITSVSKGSKSSIMSVDEVRVKLQSMGLEPLYNKETMTEEKFFEVPFKEELYQRLDRIRSICGKLCQMNDVESMKKNTIYTTASRDTSQSNEEQHTAPYLAVPDVNCPALMGLDDIDASSTQCKEKRIPRGSSPFPRELLPFYSLHGAANLDSFKPAKCQVYLGDKGGAKSNWETGNLWKRDDVDKAIEEVKLGTLRGTYGPESVSYVRDILQRVSQQVKGSSVLVIGSETPWLEATLLSLGAAKVTTLEYGSLVSEHPQIDTMTPDVFRTKYFDGTLGQFDGIVSHSSLEHSGLGRYGDALNPWGDILTVARAWCVTKPDGWLYVGVPGCSGDGIISNHHRLYGELRWQLLTTNWKPLEVERYATQLACNRGGFKWGGHGHLFVKVDPTTMTTTTTTSQS